MVHGTAAEIAIRIRDLRFRYPDATEDALNFPGCIVFRRPGLTAIVGESGAGKSTLIDILMGQRQPSSGSVEVLGVSLETLRSDAQRQMQLRKVGIVLQDYDQQLHQERTVRANLIQALVDADVRDSHERERRVELALAKVSLDHLADRVVGTLSGGQRQRVAIASSLARDVVVLFADEPTAGLDLPLRDRIFLLFKEVAKNRPVVLVTHDTDLAARCDEQFTLPRPAGGPMRAAGAMTPMLRRSRGAPFVAVALLLAGLLASGAVAAAAGLPVVPWMLGIAGLGTPLPVAETSSPLPSSVPSVSSSASIAPVSAVVPPGPSVTSSEAPTHSPTPTAASTPAPTPEPQVVQPVTPGPTPTPAPVINSLGCTSPVQVSQIVSCSPSVSGTFSDYIWSADGGSPSGGAKSTFQTLFGSAGSHNIGLSLCPSNGQCATGSQTILVTPAVSNQRTFTLPSGSDGWLIRTGIILSPGDTVQVQASGRINNLAMAPTGMTPDGDRRCTGVSGPMPQNTYLPASPIINGQPCWALIAAVYGGFAPIGAGSSFTAGLANFCGSNCTPTELYLEINIIAGSASPSTTGSWAITVTINRKT